MNVSRVSTSPPRSVKRSMKNFDNAFVKSIEVSVHTTTRRAPSLSYVKSAIANDWSSSPKGVMNM